ncbi:hypothetical protein MBLNU459_g2312t1 [Dothideomycetes sp. NU459]
MPPKCTQARPDKKKKEKEKKKKEKKKKKIDANRPQMIRTALHFRDAQTKILCRFYEPLVLLYTLGQARGRKPRALSSDNDAVTELRRRFLNDLAYICDYDKGGDTVTAIALQDTPSAYIFWIVANTDVKKRTLAFVKSLLDRLKNVSEHNKDSLREFIAAKCIRFARLRIKKYLKLLDRLIGEVHDIIKTNQILIDWLAKFQPTDSHYTVCEEAYAQRNAPQMYELSEHVSCTGSRPTEDHVAQTFRDIRHYIGRLGYHFRAARTLVDAAFAMPCLFVGFVVKTPDVPRVPATPVPFDDSTNLKDIVVRMLPKEEVEKKNHYQECLALMDQKFELEKSFIRNYKSKTLLPRVHAELLLLEHFYENEWRFVADDKFIGCSKPACYCCALYINHHPGQFEMPSSHEKIYLNWRTPEETARTAPQHHQRILNLIIADIRKDALSQINKQDIRRHWYTDSTTGITAPARMVPVLTRIDQQDSETSRAEESACTDEDESSKTYSPVSSIHAWDWQERVDSFQSFDSSPADSSSDGGVPV